MAAFDRFWAAGDDFRDFEEGFSSGIGVDLWLRCDAFVVIEGEVDFSYGETAGTEGEERGGIVGLEFEGVLEATRGCGECLMGELDHAEAVVGLEDCGIECDGAPVVPFGVAEIAFGVEGVGETGRDFGSVWEFLVGGAGGG